MGYPRRCGGCLADELGDAGRALIDSPRRRRADVHRERRRASGRRERVVPGVLPALDHGARRRHGRVPLARGGRTAHGHARHAGEQRRPDLPSPDARTAAGEHAAARDAGGRRGGAESLPAGPGRRDPVGRESVLHAEREPRHERLSEVAVRAARLRRDAVLLQQRLAQLGAEVERPPVQHDVGGDVSLHVRAPPRGAWAGRSRSRLRARRS